MLVSNLQAAVSVVYISLDLGRKLWVCGIWSHDQKEPSIHRIKRNNGYGSMLNKLERLIRGLQKKHGSKVQLLRG